MESDRFGEIQNLKPGAESETLYERLCFLA